MLSDDKLIDQIKYGNERAAEELITRYYVSILRYCRWHCSSVEKAEDLTQETFYKLFKNISSYKGKRKFKAYLYTIAKMALNGYVIIPKWPDLDQVISLHSRISNNLNQYARKANETGKLYEEDIAEIKQMYNEQTKFLKKILEAVMYLYEEDSKKKK